MGEGANRSRLQRSPIPGKRLIFLLSGCLLKRQRELPCKSNDLAPVPPRDRFWSSQREQPPSVGELPEVKLWTAKMRLQAEGKEKRCSEQRQGNEKAFDSITRTDLLCLLFRNEKRALLPSCRRPLPAAVTTAHERLTLAA